jgi:ketosteroid isomerase-like protein
MRKVLIGTIILFFFVSCANKEESTTTTSGNDENTNAKTRAVYKAIETGDVSGLDSIIDKDFVDHTAMGDVKGIDSVKAILADMHNHFDGLKFDVIAQANSGEYHFSLVNFSGTVKDDYMGMKAGTSMSAKGIDLVRIKDGKGVEHWDFMASSDMMKMMPADMSHDKMGPKNDTTKMK